MESEKVRIRKDFQPLTIATSLKVLTPLSPTLQVYNGKSGEFEPDRGVTPTMILPEIIANSSDGSWNTPYANSLLSEMKWYINGKELSTVESWKNKYSINTAGDSRGAITIYRNVSPGETFELYFEGVISDTRLGINYPIKTETVTLFSTDKSVDKYALSINDDQIIQYNPFIDKLLLYDYKVANNLISASTAARNEAKDENAYERTIKITAFRENEITSGYTLSLYKVESNGTLTLVSSSREIMSLTLTSITLDLRLIEKCDYMLIMKVGSEEVARKQFSVNRVYPKFRIEPASGVSINPGDIIHYNKAMVHYNGNVVPIPAPILKMIWKSDSSNLANVEHNEGQETVIVLSRTGIGNTYLDDWLDVYVEAEQKSVMNVIIDKSNVEYTTKSGEIYIN